MTDEEWAASIVNVDLLEAYAESAAALGTTDLVMCLNVAEDGLVAFRREKLQADWRKLFPDPSTFSKQLSEPATDHTALQMAFWFVVQAPGGVVCIAVGCQRAPRKAATA